ncbi:hypothetical protein SUDANB95_03384 [Actinosynnema sp. ALI-1.44]
MVHDVDAGRVATAVKLDVTTAAVGEIAIDPSDEVVVIWDLWRW